MCIVQAMHYVIVLYNPWTIANIVHYDKPKCTNPLVVDP